MGKCMGRGIKCEYGRLNVGGMENKIKGKIGMK
jgi:hypothetical protein